MKHRKILIALAASLILLITAAGVAVNRWLLVDLPHPGELYQSTSAPSTKIFDRNGTLLYEISDPHQGLHTPLALSDIPRPCVEATIATEDASFYRNPGVDGWAIARALYINWQGGEILSGGSTITQQLARNLLLSPQERREVSVTRKLREAILAWRLARTYSKDEILTLYLNETYYGNLAYGLEAASRTYFGKHAAELDLAECAMLAGLPQSPANYNPLQDPAAARTRQGVVLDLLVKHGYLSAEDADSARREKLGFAAVPFPIEAPHFVMYIRGELERRYGLEAIYRQGLQVYTTLDLNMNNAAQQIIRYRLAELTQQRDGEPPKHVRNAAVTVLNPRTGEILAMVGSPDYFDPRIDGAVNATMATRQPGSSIKPLTYAAAFDPAIAAAHGYEPLTPASMLVDVRTAFVTKEGQPYVPQNYDHLWRGPVLLRQSLASSYNLIAVKVLDYVGLDALTDLARALGITTFDNKEFGLALTLGGGEVRLVELTAAYAALAAEGRRIEPVAISRITDHAGALIYQQPPSLNPGPPVLDPRTAYLITNILSDNYARRSTFGAGSPLQLNRPAAAKTGTTQDWRDNWTVGYTPDLVVGVWVGNADNEPMRHVSGVTGAAPIWRDVMNELLKGKPARDFPRPAGLADKEVCTDNGLVPIESSQFSALSSQLIQNSELKIQNSQFPTRCPHTLTEIFIDGTEPRRFDDWHTAIALDRRTGLRAGIGCPLEQVSYVTFTRYPAEAQAWARKQGVPEPPADYSPLCPNTEPASQLHPSSPSLHPSSFPLHPLIFTSPDQGSVFRLVPNIPADKQKIRVSVRPAEGVQVRQVSLRVNGQPLADGPEALWQMRPGEYTFEAVGVDAAGQPLTGQRVTVRVVE
ncbi:MAG: Monofunctional biosynthetic peptidoglycan transglycosylase [Anaerolineae bacterium]|nr:Monofunctional biosynthetic peptidoglycan transglycosylase [Anaerolineae bacterium]